MTQMGSGNPNLTMTLPMQQQKGQHGLMGMSIPQTHEHNQASRPSGLALLSGYLHRKLEMWEECKYLNSRSAGGFTQKESN